MHGRRRWKIPGLPLKQAASRGGKYSARVGVQQVQSKEQNTSVI